MPVRVDVTPLVASCKAAADQLEDVDPVTRAAAQVILAAARPPVRTGRLRDSGQVTTAGKVVWAAPYAARVEARRHYAAQAARDALDDVVDLFTKHAADAASNI